jgi:hypothetical protein
VALLVASCSGAPSMVDQGVEARPSLDVVYPTEAVPGCLPMDGDGVLSVTAVGVRFEPLCLAATANRPFVLDLENRDAGIRHNLSIYAGPRMYAVNAPNLFRGSASRGRVGSGSKFRVFLPGLGSSCVTSTRSSWWECSPSRWTSAPWGSCRTE